MVIGIMANIKNLRLKERGGKRRGNLQIIADILRVLEDNGGAARKTEIVYRANLNAKRAGVYLNLMEERGFISRDNFLYYITDKGRDFLANYRQIETILEAASCDR